MVKKVNIDLRREIHAQAKIVSILKNISLNKYLENCIEKALQEDEVLLHAFTSQKRANRQNRDTKKDEEIKSEEVKHDI